MPFTCKSCGAPITFAITENGHRMPLDPNPAAGGNILVTRGLDASGKPALFAETVDPAAQPKGKALHRAHKVTCSGRTERTGPTGGVHVP